MSPFPAKKFLYVVSYPSPFIKCQKEGSSSLLYAYLETNKAILRTKLLSTT